MCFSRFPKSTDSDHKISISIRTSTEYQKIVYQQIDINFYSTVRNWFVWLLYVGIMLRRHIMRYMFFENSACLCAWVNVHLTSEDDIYLLKTSWTVKINTKCILSVSDTYLTSNDILMLLMPNSNGNNNGQGPRGGPSRSFDPISEQFRLLPFNMGATQPLRPPLNVSSLM